MVIIENVPEVLNNRSDVVTAAKALLKANGYDFMDSGMLAAHEMGWAQTRKRYFLIAARRTPADADLTLKAVAHGLKRGAQSVGWAIGDLMLEAGSPIQTGVMDTVPALSEENRSAH